MAGQSFFRQFMPLGIDLKAKPRVCAVCARTSGIIEQVTQKDFGIRFQGRWCCSPNCFRAAVERGLQRLLTTRSEAVAERRYRFPLGLLMLSQGVIDRHQLATALRVQKQSGSGRIGEWILKLGYATEDQVARALSVQWGYPMLRSVELSETRSTWIPLTLQFEYGVVPVHYSSPSRTLYLAVSSDIDRSLFNGLEQMLECKVQPCIIAESAAKRELDAARRLRNDGVVFETEQSVAEMSRICTSYAVQTHASEMGVFRCDQYFWLRLKRASSFNPSALDIFFRCSNNHRQTA